MSGMTLPATASRFGVTEILAATGGVLHAGPPEGSEAAGVSTDSRSLVRGELFVALSGPREQPVRIVLDGHRFVGAALRGGAWGVLVEGQALQREELVRELAAWPGRAVIVVPDSLRALGDLAAYHRRRMPARIVGITGSNGKTTTKEMAFAILAARLRVLRSEGNLNNLVGLPLTLLGLEAGHEAAVVEMGMSRAGEIRRLAAIAAPQVGVVTNVGPVHLEGVGGFAGVAAAKAEIFEEIAPGGTAVLNADDPATPGLAERWAGNRIGFGLSAAAAVRAENIASAAQGTAFTLVLPDGERARVQMPWLGEHNVRNALAAAAAAHCLGADCAQIGAGLMQARPAAMRFEISTCPPGVTVVNDAYNANPASMRAALAAFALLPAAPRRALVLGDMLELGAAAPAEHQGLGRVAAQTAPALLLAVGAFAERVAEGARAEGLPASALATAPDAEAAAHLLAGWLRRGDLLLLKGSRGVRLERILERLRAAEGQT
ncbi:MAG: UDP-N-acetylmuramoyl-tripeptide--D-alanyl-D-alanine ligase [Candidatus Methylomirabilia bacterium]